MYCGLRDWLFCWLADRGLVAYAVSGGCLLVGCFCGNLVLG